MSNDKPRYSRVSDILDLAIYMSSKAQGVTITEIAERYNVSRRTAERMRDSLTCIFPAVDEIETNDTQKHWGFINYSISSLVNFSAKEIVNLEQLHRRTTNKELKNELMKTIEKIKTLNKKNLNSVENNIELFLQTEGYAIRQMPKYKIDINTLDVIREGIQHSKMVSGIYHDKKRLLEPLGLIYGEKIYLIAREKVKGKDIYTYLLHKFENLKVLDKTFDKKGFDLQEYTKLSFGVYHGELLDVKLKFDIESSADAIKYDFHPSQQVQQEIDGTVTVSFKASGIKEIIWHIFKWGNHCQIIEPKSLQDYYLQYLKDCMDAY